MSIRLPAARLHSRSLISTAVLALLIGMTTSLPAVADQDATPPVLTQTQDSKLIRADAISARVTAHSIGRRVEDLSERTETSQTFVNPDGSLTTEEASEPERVQDADGDWHAIDTTLVPRNGGLAPKYAVSDVLLSDGGDKTFAAMSESGNDLDWRWPTQLPEPSVQGDTATYADVVPGGDLVVRVLPTGFSHSIVLRERPTEPLKIITPVLADDARVVEGAGGSLAVETKSGDELVTAPQPLMWDSSSDDAGEPAIASVDAAVGETSAGTPTVELSPNADFLSNPATVYPVTVDPSFTSWVTGDTFVQNKDLTSGQGNNEELRVGTYDSGTHIARTFLHFDGDGWVGRHVLSAQLVMRNFTSTTCVSSAIRVRPVNAAWDADKLTWANQPDLPSDSNYADYDKAWGGPNCTYGDAVWEVGSMVNDWASGAKTNNGFRLTAVDYTNTQSWRKYRSANYDGGGSAVRPKLVVTYNNYPGQAQTPTVDPLTTFAPIGGTASSYTSTQTPTFSSTASDPDGTTGVLFEVYDNAATSGTRVGACYTRTDQPSGATVSCQSSGLADGGTYWVKAKAYDGTDFAGQYQTAIAGWSSPTKFIVATGTPAAPSISCSQAPDKSWAKAVPNEPLNCSVTVTGSGVSSPGYLRYSIDDGDETRTKIAQPTSTNSTVIGVNVPNTQGAHSIVARAESPSGQLSTLARYGFGYGDLTMTQPAGDAAITTVGRVSLRADGPSLSGNLLPSATLRWRVAAGTDGPDSGWNNEQDSFGVTGSSTSPVTVTGVWDTSDLGRDDAHGIDLDPRLPLLLEVQLCLHYTSIDRCTGQDKPTRVLRIPHAFGDNFPVTDAGPGEVALATGEFMTHATDVSVPAASNDLSVVRTHSSFDLASTSSADIFGEGWNASLQLSDVSASQAQVMDDTLVDGIVILSDSSGNNIALAPNGRPVRRSSADLTAGEYKPISFEDDGDPADVLEGTRASVTGTGLSTRFVLTDETGAVTTFKVTRAPTATSPAQFAIDSVQDAQAESETSYQYDALGRVIRVIAAPAVGVTCTPPALAPGCHGLVVSYYGADAVKPTGEALGSFPSLVSKIEYQSYDAKTSAMTSASVATYQYDKDGHLALVKDANGLTTRYGYTGAGASLRLVKLTPPGQAPYTLNYAQDGRFTSATRASNEFGQSMLRHVRYDVPLQTAGLPNVSQAVVQAWAQAAVPSHAYAVFGSSRQDVSESTALSTEDWKSSTVYFTDDEFRVVNTAGYGNGKWLLTADDYDASGNAVRSLSATDIAAVGRGQSAADVGTLTNYKAVLAPDGHELIPAGRVVTDTFEPARQVRMSDGAIKLVRPHTVYDFDAGAPNGDVNPATNEAYGLLTSTKIFAWNPATGSNMEMLSSKTLGYDAAVAGDPNGWSTGLVTKTAVGLSGQADLVTTTRYDSRGRLIETRQPMSNGSDGGTTSTVYYTAGPNTATPACGGKPEWAGLKCETARSVPGLPGKREIRTTEFDMFLSPTTVIELQNGAVQRTRHFESDAGGRLVRSWVTSNIPGDAAAPGQMVTYDASSGAATKVSGLDNNGATTSDSIVSSFDDWGRVTSYGPAPDETTTTRYDRTGRVSSIADPQATTTFNYDGDGTNGRDADAKEEHRGLPTGLTVRPRSGAAFSISGAYDEAGNLLTQRLPGGIVQRIQYDDAELVSGMSYSGDVQEQQSDGSFATRADRPWLAWSQQHDALGRTVREWTPEGASLSGGTPGTAAASYSRAFAYDSAGRLTHVEDRTGGSGLTGPIELDGSASSGSMCQTRDYSWDADGNRSSLKRTSGSSCGSGSVQTRTWNHDSADRHSDLGYEYDSLGRVSRVPSVDTPAGSGDALIAYFGDDAVRSISQAGVSETFSLDVTGRRASTTYTTTGESVERQALHYADSSDGPRWIEKTVGAGSPVISYTVSSLVDSAVGSLTGGNLTLSLTDPRGNSVTDVSVPAIGNAPGLDSWRSFDEFGLASQNSRASGQSYGWWGAAERPTDGTGFVLMGARLYDPVTGEFTSRDPISGGNSTDYAYPQDPINSSDLSGRCAEDFCIGEAAAAAGAAEAGGAALAAAAVASVALLCKVAECSISVRGVIIPIASVHATAAWRYKFTSYVVYKIFWKTGIFGLFHHVWKYGITRQVPWTKRPQSQLGTCEKDRGHECGYRAMKYVMGWLNARTEEAKLAFAYVLLHGDCPPGMRYCK